MKKVLIITSDFYPQTGGVANYWKNLLQSLPKDGFHVLALKTNTPELPGDYQIHRASFFTKWFWPRWLPLLINAYRLIKQKKFDTVIVGQILPVGTVMWLINKVVQVPYYVSFHGMDIHFAQLKSRKAKMFKHIVQGSRGVFVNSEYTLSLLKNVELIGKPQTIVYPCANVVGDAENIDYKIEHIISVGRLVPRKGHYNLILAIDQLKDKYPNLSCTIVGDGPERERLQSLIQERGLMDKVTLTGRLADEELVSEYKKASLFVLPANEDTSGDVEGFGIVFLEAASFGLPCITGKSGGVGESVINNETGIVLEENTVDSLVEAIEKMFLNRELMVQYGQAGKKRAQSDFNWQKQAEKIINLF